MCRFNKQSNSELDMYKSIIIELLKQDISFKGILTHITELGYTGKRTALNEYCKKLINELQIPYFSRKNIAGTTILNS